jgi:hypothetical protein
MDVDHVSAVNERETLYERKLALQARAYDTLQQSKHDVETSLLADLAMAQRQHETECARLKAAYERNMREQSDKLTRMKKMLTTARNQYVTLFDQQDEENDGKLFLVRIACK